MNIEKIIWDFFKEKGLTDYGIAGLMGNLYAESGLNPKNLQQTYEKKLNMTDEEYTNAVDNGTYTNFVHDQAGYGLAQWTYWSLKDDLLDFCKEKNKSVGDLNTQLEFLAYQLSTDYKLVWETLKTATSVLDASNAVLLKFEKPADQSSSAQAKRALYGTKYYTQYSINQNTTIQSTIKQTSSNKGDAKMKYSETNKPLVCMQTQNSCYKNTSKMSIKGVLWHSTGANNPNLKRYVQPSDDATDREEQLKLIGTNSYKNDLNHTSGQIGLNAWIGKLANGTVESIQSMPWDYKPWGCASGSKGSCNNGWIQFEICEDGLKDKIYFEAVYKEACELTAYLCNLYNINPKGTVLVNGVKIPTILCHADAYALGFGSNHGDVLHWFSNFGKTMDDVRNDVEALLDSQIANTPLDEENKIEEEKANTLSSTNVQMYRVRKTWEDSKSQVGAYTNLDNAKQACDKAGKDYEVYNSQGVAIYPTNPVEADIEESVNPYKIGDEVKLIKNAKYSNGMPIPTWLENYKLYVRNIKDNNIIIISTKKTGAITGAVTYDQVIPYTQKEIVNNIPDFVPYIVRINTDTLNVRTGPGTNYKIKTQVHKHELYTIINEKDGWGKLKSGVGWILLDYTQKIK